VTVDTTYEIQGRTLTFPIQVRDADSWAAQFLVPAKAAQKIVEPTGLEVATPLPGRAVVNIAFVDYRDTDLDAYHDGVYIHQLPVTQSFTMEAGQSIWGYPKFLANIPIDRHGKYVTCTLDHDGTHVLTMRLKEGGPIRLPQRDLPTYSLRDDVLRRTAWDQEATTRARLGGAKLTLGPHPIADELRTLGLPKRALMCSTMRGMSARFGPALNV
jgi:hypothetical protein